MVDLVVFNFCIENAQSSVFYLLILGRILMAIDVQLLLFC